MLIWGRLTLRNHQKRFHGEKCNNIKKENWFEHFFPQEFSYIFHWIDVIDT